VLLRPAIPARFAPQITLLAGVAAAAAALAEGVMPVLKWPNDLLLHDRKAGGVLAELEVGPEGSVDFVVLGIGLNLNVPPEALPADVAPIATSFAAVLGRPVDRSAFARRLLEALDAWFARFRRDGFGPVREAWTRLSGLPGRRLSVAIGARGGATEIVAGVARGLGDDGALLLDTAAGPRAILSGQVAVLEARAG
jgi:BirA family biotin operon repressor/biotin-[acetyl-CoA-carboxylase] ligase